MEVEVGCEMERMFRGGGREVGVRPSGGGGGYGGLRRRQRRRRLDSCT